MPISQINLILKSRAEQLKLDQNDIACLVAKKKGYQGDRRTLYRGHIAGVKCVLEKPAFARFTTVENVVIALGGKIQIVWEGEEGNGGSTDDGTIFTG